MSKKKVSEAGGMPVWITREPKRSYRRCAADCMYGVWVGEKPRFIGSSWAQPERCEYVTSLCSDVGARFMRKHGMTLRPGGGPLECVLKMKVKGKAKT